MKRANNLEAGILLVLYAVFESCKGVSMGDLEKAQIIKEEIERAIIDMGVDYNDEPVPGYLKSILTQAVAEDSIANTYITSRGDPQLRGSIGKFYSKLMDRQLNFSSEIITTVGATEALVSTLRALSKPGDEWILIEPFFNMFKSAIELAYAVPRYAYLEIKKGQNGMTAADWELNMDEMKKLINEKTKGIIFNNPNNPLGKKYTRQELELIAQLATDNNLLVISDEVHEFTTDTHIVKMATLPDMFNRTLTIGSASKALCVPGWRVGWIIGPKHLIDEINNVHGNTVNFVSTAQQRAVSVVFEDEYKNFGYPETFLGQNLASIRRKREFVVKAFRDAGMQPIAPEGGYCMLAGWLAADQISKVTLKQNTSSFTDIFKERSKVKAFTAEKYYGDDEHKRKNFYKFRFCYHKSNLTLQNAAKNLLKVGTGFQILKGIADFIAHRLVIWG